MNDLEVMVVDDHPIYRDALLNAVQDMDFVGEVRAAENGRRAIEQIGRKKPDLVLLDLYMPEMDGIETTSYLGKYYPEIQIIVITSLNSRKQIVELLELGVGGFLLKGSDMNEVENAIKCVVTGGGYFSQEVREIYKSYLQDKAKGLIKNDSENALTKREIQILQQICKQQTAKEIADKLYLSPYTINNHRHNISKKTGISNTVGLVLYAIQHGYFDPLTDIE